MSVSLNGFTLDDLAPFKREKSFAARDSADFRVFYVGRDNVHGVLSYLWARCSRSHYFNAYGYDDEQLDSLLRAQVESKHVYVQGTLDKSQYGGVHEKKIVGAWSPQMRASVIPGRSATGDISHTKGGVLDGLVAYEGSTNLSASGEGIWVQDSGPGGKGFHAQNNTLMVATHPVFIAEFTAELCEEHAIALAQAAKAA